MFFSSKKIDSKWKEKAKQRSIENKKLKKRNQELSKSRDNWKNKSESLKTQLKEEKKKFTLI
jgi:hypothetical protein